MAFLSAKELVNLPANSIVYVEGHDMYSGTSERKPRTQWGARRILAANKQAILELRQSKTNRPYLLVNLYDGLDQAQNWYGWELEGGFQQRDNYKRVVDYVWSNINHVTIDREGAGYFPAEITFAPENESMFAEGKAAIQRTVNFINRNDLNDVGRFHRQVGTHVNISTPAWRLLNYAQMGPAVDAVNRALRGLSQISRAEFFGRDPYGWAYLRGDGATGRTRWIEFKLFQSSYNPAVVANHQRVAQRIAVMMSIFSDALRESTINRPRLDTVPASQVVAFLRGETDILNTTVQADPYGYY